MHLIFLLIILSFNNLLNAKGGGHTEDHHENSKGGGNTEDRHETDQDPLTGKKKESQSTTTTIIKEEKKEESFIFLPINPDASDSDNQLMRFALSNSEIYCELINTLPEDLNQNEMKNQQIKTENDTLIKLKELCIKLNEDKYDDESIREEVWNTVKRPLQNPKLLKTDDTIEKLNGLKAKTK
jgi:hypothetical protein